MLTHEFFFLTNFPHSSLLLVYEGKDDDESERLSQQDTESSKSCHYDADISNCSTDLINISHDESHQQCPSNDDNDCGIGHEDMEQCLYDAGHSAQTSDIGEDETNESKFLDLNNKERPVSPHSMDSWLNYSNSSDEYSQQDLIVHKGTKLNLHDELTQDDVDVYDKINFVNAKSSLHNKKSKISVPGTNDKNNTATGPNNFLFPLNESSQRSSNSIADRIANDKDDGIDVELEDDDDDDQLSSLSSNIDTIIVSDTGETKFFNAAGEEQEDYPSSKKKKSADNSEEGTIKKSQLINGHGNNVASNNNKASPPLVDVRIIDFAHTTFTAKNVTDLSPTMGSKKVHHHGPDSGFLTGINSLKRILSDILVESI